MNRYPGDVLANNNLAAPWVFWVFLISLMVLAYLKVNYQKGIGDLFRTMGNRRLLIQVMREELSSSNRAASLLLIVFFLSAGMLFYHLHQLFHISLLPGNGLLSYLQISGVLVFAYLIKSLTIRFVGLLSNGEQGLLEYDYTFWLYNKTLGILLLPLLIFGTYVGTPLARYFILFSIGLMMIFYLLRIGRGILHAIQYRVRAFYIILYLCTLEILPLAILFKLISA